MNPRVANCFGVYGDGNDTLRGMEDMSKAALGTGVNSPHSRGKRRTRFQWRGFLAVFPAIGASILPIGTCPACWPVYAGLLSSLGLGFLFDSAYLLPVTALFLGFSVAALAYRAKARRGYRPLAIGAVGAVVVLVGKFVLSSDSLFYLGLVALIGASLWNAWPKKKAARSSCPACASQVAEVRSSSAEHGG